MCKCCQSCLESLYWNCCEERFCYDETIAYLADNGPSSAWDEKCYTNGYDNGVINDNMGYPPVTRQPEGRGVLVEVPILSPNIYEVFAKSMIFTNDSVFNKFDNEDSVDGHKNSNGYYTGSVGKVVSFEDNNNTKNVDLNKENEDEKLPDFYIMFQDEIFTDHKMTKIEEEEEDDSSGPKSPTSPEDFGISMKSLEKIEPKRQESVPDFAARLADPKVLLKAESLKSIIRVPSENSAKHLPRAKSALYLPRTDSSKSITRNNSRHDIKRVDSMKNIDRIKNISRQDLTRVDSMKNLDANIKNVLARLPQRSASFLSIPHYDNIPDQPRKSQSQDVFAISSAELDAKIRGEPYLLSRGIDTPVIKGGKFPLFYAETPEIGAYKAETSLQSIVTTPEVIHTEIDFSMPRYFGKSKNIAAVANIEPGVHSSRSMPDLHLPDGVSKRLAKFKTKLAPLIIKRHDSTHEGSSHH